MEENLLTQLITGILSCPIIYIRTSHYAYVDEILNEIIETNILPITFKDLYEFDLARGVVYFDTKAVHNDSKSTENLIDFITNHIDLDSSTPQISLIKNCGREVLNDITISTLLSTVASQYELERYDRLSTVILVSPDTFDYMPRAIIDITKVLELKSPSIEEIEEIVKAIPISKQVEMSEDLIRLEFSRNLQGLSLADIRQIKRSCLIRTGGKLSEHTIRLALQEKKHIVKKSGILEVIDADESLEDVGGLENLKKEIMNKKIIFEHLSLSQSKSASVPIPKGVLLIGMPGCGKSMIAKAIASEFKVALLRLDINRLMGKYVGESETNLRRALEIAEAAHPCVLWIDEIEKAFAGTGKGNNDIVERLMGYFLTWMQERKSAVYVVATANDALKPELMRKGRFDDVFFVDFPDEKEIRSILKKCLLKYKEASFYNWDNIGDKELSDIVNEIRGFSGAEINGLVGAVVENAFRSYILKLESESMPSKSEQKIIIKVNDFKKMAEEMKPYIMSIQLSKKNTAIYRISKLKENFNIKSATGKFTE